MYIYIYIYIHIYIHSFLYAFDRNLLVNFLLLLLISEHSSGKIIRRFHLGVRHAADTLGIPAHYMVEYIKSSNVMTPGAIDTLKGFRFKNVEPFVKGKEVKSQYGVGTILELRGIEGVPGFSLVVQLGSWVLAGGQKPLLYCEADEVLGYIETSGVLTSSNKRRNRSAVEATLAQARAFLGTDNIIGVDERQQQKEEASRRSNRTSRYIKNDKEGNVVIEEFHRALYYYLNEKNNTKTCKWLNFGQEFIICEEHIVAQGVRSLMAFQTHLRERKRQKQWLLKELYNHGFIRTRSVYFFVGYMLYAVLVAHLKYALTCFFFPPSV